MKKNFSAGDALVLLGTAAIVSGIAMMHVPSAVILAGAVTAAVGYLLSTQK